MKAAREISGDPQSDLQKAFYDLVVFALNTGLRKSEILNLKWRDIKGEDIEVKGKGEKQRMVPLNETALGIIEKQPKKTAYVFDVPYRNQQDLLRRTVLQLRKRPGIPDLFHFHLLRHTFTTRLIEKGVDFVTISEILGHSKITTSLIYSHTDKDRKKRAVDSILD